MDDRRGPALPLGLLVVLTLAAAGCNAFRGSAGTLRSESLGPDRVVLHGTYETVVYAHNPAGDTSFFLSDIPLDDLIGSYPRDGQVIHIELLWEPKPGATPMDASATNASIRHVVVAGGEVGVYGGAGFALPHGTPGSDNLTVTLRDATVRLLESTKGFADPLSPARITGTFSAHHDPLLARKLHRAVTQMVTNAVGKPWYVYAGSDQPLIAPILTRSAGWRCPVFTR